LRTGSNLEPIWIDIRDPDPLTEERTPTLIQAQVGALLEPQQRPAKGFEDPCGRVEFRTGP
jgi:hypothetical protein